jgi:hypothetical protein
MYNALFVIRFFSSLAYGLLARQQLQGDHVEGDHAGYIGKALPI